MALALLSRSRSKPQASVKSVPQRKSAGLQQPADAWPDFAKPVFQPQIAALPTAPSVPLLHGQSEILQRKCACGGAAGMSGECEECGKKQRLGLQTKLKINEPGDSYEREADRVADQVMAEPTSPGFSGAPLRIQRFAAHPAGQMAAAPAWVDQALASPGRPLEPALRRDMEQRFGHDFSQVRVHTGPAAEQSAREVNAHAYTVGHNMVFGTGQFTPETQAGRRLIAHELVHVTQQGGSHGSDVLQRKPRTHWRDDKPIFYNDSEKKIALDQIQYVQNLGKSDLLGLDGTIKVDPAGLVKEKEGWTFYYFPLTRDEAEAAKTAAEAKLGKKDVFTVEFDKRAQSFFIKPQCPAAVPDEAGWTPWSDCFKTEEKAQAQVEKFKKANIEAKTVRLSKDDFVVLFQPLTEAEARAKGEAEAKTRGGSAKGVLFTATPQKAPGLKSFTYTLEPTCPSGFKPLKEKFKITSYFTAVESDFPEQPTVKDPCVKGTFSERFLHKTEGESPFGVDKEGNGRTRAGKIIHRESKNCYKEVRQPLGVRDLPLTVGSSVAVDRTKIPIGTQLLIEDVGLRTADDVGGAVKGNQIDDFKGDFDQAKDTTLPDMLVCQKQKP